ncbi:MAG: right-handed parallel beta-helix repeat-containing protein, partial [Candidatus Thermoplasmatota archaeon]|nr:right-handed parallel beta-helix repeat-containing protein [Candidatus Thermoplasmatota archaeon]
MKDCIKRTIVLSLSAFMLFSGIVLFNNWLSDISSGANVYHTGGTSGDENWAAANIHYVDDEYNVSSGDTLTIQAGATVYMDGHFGLRGNITVENGGKLVIEGSSGNYVYMTSNATNPAAGDYGGIVVEDGGIAYVNYTFIGNATIGVDIDGGNTEVNYCIINETSDLGINFTGSGAPVIKNCTISNTGNGVITSGGISIESNGLVTGCTIFNSNTTGVHVNSGTPKIEDTYIHNTTGNGIRINGTAVPEIEDCNISDTNDHNIFIIGSSRNIVIYNSTIGYRNGYGVRDTIKIDATGDFVNLTLLNSTFVNDTFDVDSKGNLSIDYHVVVYVNNSADAPIPGATVDMLHNGSVHFSGTTDSNGEIWIQGIHFMVNATGYWIIGNYTVNVTHPDYQSSEQNTYVDSYQALDFQLTDTANPVADA